MVSGTADPKFSAMREGTGADILEDGLAIGGEILLSRL